MIAKCIDDSFLGSNMYGYIHIAVASAYIVTWSWVGSQKMHVRSNFFQTVNERDKYARRQNNRNACFYP